MTRRINREEGPPPRRRWCPEGHVVPSQGFWEECETCANCRAGHPPWEASGVEWPTGHSFLDASPVPIWVNVTNGNPAHVRPVF